MQGTWIKQSEDSQLPDWLKSNIRDKCECGHDMENFYNVSGQITARRCTNPKCPHVMAQKITAMCDILKVKGIGYKTGLSLIKTHNLTSHFEAIPYILEEKPRISICNLLRCNFIQGVDTKWSTVDAVCATVDDIFSVYSGEFKDLLLEHKTEILESAKYFSIIEKYKPKFEPVVTGTVMLSGNIKGIPNRNTFIAGINYGSQGLIDIRVSEHKRKTGVMALIQEADSPRQGKAQCAEENGIPIMTPDEFKKYVANLLVAKMRDPEIKARVEAQLQQK